MIDIVLSLIGVTGIILLGLAALLRLMPNLPYPRIRSLLFRFFPQGESYQDARDAVLGTNQLRTIRWQRHPEIIDTVKPIINEELDIGAEEINKVEFLHRSLRIDARGDTTHTRGGYDQPREFLDGLIEQEQQEYYDSRSVIVLAAGIVCSILGSLTILF